LALKYHPKSNPNDEVAHNKFVEVNEAYNALSNEFKRQNYDNIVFGTIAPLRAHSIFDDFFGPRLTSFDDDIGTLFHPKWTRDLDRMLDESEEPNLRDGESVKTSSVWTNKNGQ
jgi:curved DNA-binding protein CbpA